LLLLLLLLLLLFFFFFFFLERPLRPVVSNRIGMKFGRNVLQVNMHRLTESDFRLSHKFKMAAMTSFRAKKVHPHGE